jgi:hypothetical protein
MANQNSLSQQIILLTATITPPTNAKNLVVTDSALRLQQYVTAFEFYLKQLSQGYFTHLVFVDNSGSDCSALIQLAEQYKLTQQVEVISFDGLDYPAIYGRGYGEFKLVEYVMQHAKTMQMADDNAAIWKITGRYIVDNLQSVILKSPQHADFYCHCRNHPIHWIDLFILKWKKSAYRPFLHDVYLQLIESNDGHSSEQKFRQLVDENRANIHIVKRFNVIPRLIGVRGYDNQPYQNSYKYQIRSIANTLLPFIWI